MRKIKRKKISKQGRRRRRKKEGDFGISSRAFKQYYLAIVQKGTRSNISQLLDLDLDLDLLVYSSSILMYSYPAKNLSNATSLNFYYGGLSLDGIVLMVLVLIIFVIMVFVQSAADVKFSYDH